MAKRLRTAPQPQDLAVGQAVVYWDDQDGVICDAWAPLNQFWVRDRASGDVVRDEGGEIVAFGAEQLRLAAAPGQGKGQAASSARVLLIGTEAHMLKILEHFGPPDISERREPQMLLAMPCTSCCCGPACTRFDAMNLQTCDKATCPLLTLAAQGVEPGVEDLASSLRPDREGQIALRAYHMKQAMEQLGPDLLSLTDFYCLAAITLPYGLREIETGNFEDRHTMEEVRCQIDLGVTAEGRSIEGEASLDATARRVLGEACGVSVSDKIWDEDVQFRLRKALGVDLPIRYWDGPEAKGFVLILPSDLSHTMDGGLLRFAEPSHGSSAAMQSSAAGVTIKSSELVGGKTVSQWKAEQDQFKGLPKLPEGWIRIKSRSSEETYFYNTRTQSSTFEFPLPDGWTKQRSKSNGKVYYFHAKKRQSSYEIPTE